MSLFHSVLGSGSCGNSYVFYDGKDAILIDQGFSLAELKRRLERVNVPIEKVRAVFLTHFHPDHHKGLGVISRKLQVPIYMNKEGIEGEPVVFAKLNLPVDCIKAIEVGEITTIGNFEIEAFKTSHDSKGSVGYFIQNNADKITLITDTGITTDIMMNYAKDSDYLFLEANYDEKLLFNGPYPYFLKKRVSGNWGHLSNDQAFDFIDESGFNGKGVFFVHLSSNNNKVEIVDNLAKKRLSDINFITCPRGELINTSEVNFGEKK